MDLQPQQEHISLFHNLIVVSLSRMIKTLWQIIVILDLKCWWDVHFHNLTVQFYSSTLNRGNWTAPGKAIYSAVPSLIYHTWYCSVTGVFSTVWHNLGKNNHQSRGWQSDHFRVGGPSGYRPLHDFTAKHWKQQGHPGYHDRTGGSTEPQTGNSPNPPTCLRD